MNNLQFFELQHEIQDAMDVLAELQTRYRKMTGVKFISGQVIKDPKFCDTCRFLCEDGLGWFCNCEASGYFEKRHPVYGCAEHDEEGGDG